MAITWLVLGCIKEMKTQEEIGKECNAIRTNANQEIQHINDKIGALEVQRGYQKGLRDAASILRMFEKEEVKE